MRFVFAQVFGFHNDNRKPMGTLVGQETQNKKSSKTTHVKSHTFCCRKYLTQAVWVVSYTVVFQKENKTKQNKNTA